MDWAAVGLAVENRLNFGLLWAKPPVGDLYNAYG